VSLVLSLMATAIVGATQARTDSNARLIIANAIARRHATLEGLGQCRYTGFVKEVARDLGESQDSARSVLLLAEAHSSAYWEYPDRYQEIVEARHRWTDAGIGRAMVSVREILHLSEDGVDLEGGADASGVGNAPTRSNFRHRRGSGIGYSIVSPIASDALDHYAYVVQDTLVEEERRIFRLGVEPKSDASPLFTGTIDIADSTFDVVAMDLGVTSAVQFPDVLNLRYEQHFKDWGDGRWMPYEVRLTGELRRAISAHWLPQTLAGFRLPEFPRHVSFEQMALFSAYNFDRGPRPSDLAEYRAVVRDQADAADSGTWSGPGAVPLTAAERKALYASDYTEHHPALLPRLAQEADAVQRTVLGPGSFHFNRVDGTYVGVAPTWPATRPLVVSTKVGYALGSEVWQYRVAGQVAVSAARRIWLGAAYHDETMAWPALATGGYDPTASALVGRGDPNNYYRERGGSVSFGTKLVDFTQLELRYDDMRQSSQDTVAGLGFHSRQPPLPNPPITEGRLRSLSAMLTFDSRQLVRSRGADYRLGSAHWTRVSVRTEIAAPFRRYVFQLDQQEQTRALGTTTLTVAGGVNTHGAPPQRYFTIGLGRQLLAAEGVGFNTLARTQYAGSRALMVLVRQDFGRRLRSIPATLSLHAGVFWSTLVDYTPTPADTMLRTAPTPYEEAGLSLGHLTPFLSPFDLAVSFTWQLSSYPTDRFHFGVGFTGP
jgi:hypothetical protein